MKYQAVIFDLDGTLLDTLGDLATAVNHALSTFGFPTRTIDEVRRFVGNGFASLISQAVPAETDGETVTACLSVFRAYYASHLMEKTAPYDGVLPLLDALKSAGVSLAVVSNKGDRAVKELCAHYFGDRIPVAIGECEGMRRKPAPDTVFAAMTALGVNAAQCVYVGDSDVDLRTAENAGIPVVSVDWGFRSRESLFADGATTVVSTAKALWDTLSE